jgi:hypothetical protein
MMGGSGSRAENDDFVKLIEFVGNHVEIVKNEEIPR